MNVNNSKTASKLQAPSFSSKLRAPTAVAKPLPEPAISENPQIQQEKIIPSSAMVSKISPVKAFASTPLKFQEPPQRFSLQPQPTKSAMKPPSSSSALKNISQQQSEVKSIAAKSNTIQPSASKIPDTANNPLATAVTVQQTVDQKHAFQQKPQQTPAASKPSMIGKGIPKPVVQINLDNESPVKTEMVLEVQAKPRASSTLGRFGFRGGANGTNQQATPIKQAELIQVKSQVHPQTIQAQEQTQPKNLFIPAAEEKPKLNLEETIKNLEQNLANLPTTFNRASRLKEFVHMQKLPPREELVQQPSIQIGFNTMGNGKNLRDRMNAKRDQYKMAKQQQQQMQHEEDDPFEQALFLPQLEQHIEEHEERNLPLTAFLQSQTLFQGSTAPIGDDALNEYEDDEDLMNDDLVFERAADFLDNDLLLDDLQPTEEQKSDDFHVQTQPQQIQVQMVKGDFDEVEELKQSSDSNIQTLSTQPTQPPEILKRPKDHHLIKPKFDQLSHASSGIKHQSQPGDQLSSFSSSSANPLQLLKQVSGGNHPRIGLSACQRQGPALAAKKAFEHKRKRFARELNADALNQHQRSINDGRQQCEHCGRRFNPDCFERHSANCVKVFIRKRKAFSSLKHRAIDETHYIQVEKAQQKFSYYQDYQKLNTKWKQRSHEFRQAILKAKGLLPDDSEEIKDQDDRVLCKYCQRKFAQITAERHIPLCEAKSKELKHSIKVIKSFSKTATSGFQKQSSFMKK